MILAIAFVVGSGYLAFRGGRVAIDRDCENPSLVVASREVATGGELPWSATGPDGDEYTVTFGAKPLRRTTAFGMSDCLADGRITAPAKAGTHDLRLLRRVDGRFVQVDRIPITVVVQSR